MHRPAWPPQFFSAAWRRWLAWAAVTGPVRQSATAPGAGRTQGQGEGYRLTAHIQRYYRSTCRKGGRHAYQKIKSQPRCRRQWSQRGAGRLCRAQTALTDAAFLCSVSLRAPARSAPTCPSPWCAPGRSGHRSGRRRRDRGQALGRHPLLGGLRHRRRGEERRGSARSRSSTVFSHQPGAHCAKGARCANTAMANTACARR